MVKPAMGGVGLGLLALAMATAGCGGLTNQYTGTQHLTIQSVIPGGSWTGYSETTFQDSLPSGKSVHLLDVTLTSSTGEFSWLDSSSGTAPSGQQIVSLSPMEGITGTANLNVDYTGDLRPLMVDSHTVKMNWDEQFAPTVTHSYPNGITVTVSYTIELE